MSKNEASLLPVGVHVVFLYSSATVIRIMNYHLIVSPIDRVMPNSCKERIAFMQFLDRMSKIQCCGLEIVQSVCQW